MKKTDDSTVHVAVVIDAWFPTHGRKRGVFGSGQVHVRELTQVMGSKYPITFTLFFPAHDNLLYKFMWLGVVSFRVMQHHHRHPFALIHVHGLNASLVGILMHRHLHLPVIQTVHGCSRMDLKSKSPRAWLEKVIYTKVRYTTQISVTASFLNYPNSNQSITVIPNGVRIEDFDEVEVEKNLQPTLIWVGRDDPSKGLNVLRQSILKIRKKIPELKTKLVTGGALTGKALIRAYKKAHVFVLPSLAEGQPITLLEAWAAKLPVIVTSVGDNQDIVQDGVNGYLVDPGNVLQLTNALLKTLRARTKNAKMGEAGYELVKRVYTWDIVAAKTWAVYQSVLSAKN